MTENYFLLRQMNFRNSLQIDDKICYIYRFRNPSPNEGSESHMPGVIVRDNEPFDRALKRFSKTCERAGIISDIKKHQYFEKPSERRKRKMKEAKRKMRKLMAQQARR